MADDELPDQITIGDKYGPAMEMTDQTAADAYFEKLVRHNMRFGTDRAKAEEVERCNLGYFAGYYNTETRQRVERLFRCCHPIFGAVADNGPPTPEEAFRLGQTAARA